MNKNHNPENSSNICSDISSREIPEYILNDIQVSREEYKNGLAIPVSDFMKKYKDGV